jgi:hypothetical protein
MGLEAPGLNAARISLARKVEVTASSSAATGLKKDTLDIPQNAVAQKPAAQKPAKTIWGKIKNFFAQTWERIKKWFRPSQKTHPKPSNPESTRLSTQEATKFTPNTIKPLMREDYRSSFLQEASSTHNKKQIQLDKNIDETIAKCVKRNEFLGFDLNVLPAFGKADPVVRDKQGNILPFENKKAQEKFENFMASLSRLKKQYEKEKEEFSGIDKAKYEELDCATLEGISHKVENADEETAKKLNTQRLVAYQQVEEILDAKIEKVNYFQQHWLDKQQAEIQVHSRLEKRRKKLSRTGH